MRLSLKEWPSNRQIEGKKYSRFIAIAIMIAVYFGSYNLAAIKKPQTAGGWRGGGGQLLLPTNCVGFFR